MKNLILSIIFINSLLINAQNARGIFDEINWTKNWTNFKPKTTDYNQSSNILSGQIDKNTTLSKNNIYLLTGMVYVTNNAVLTIEPGTVIKGDFETNGTLIVTKGSKIIAEGQESNPIIFTSNKPSSQRKSGDWGGLVIFGDAPINKFGSIGQINLNLDSKHNIYGGNNIDSDSGILKFVRIEFAGKKIGAGRLQNSLYIAGVGRKTTLENIQISFSSNDSFVCLGGQVTLKKLISFRANGNDYYFTEGAQINISNSLAVKNQYFTNPGKSRCFDIESYDVKSNADLTKKLTNVVATNVTLLNEENDNLGLIREAIFIKENATFSFTNSIISGFSQCLLMDAKINTDYENLDRIKFKDVLFNNCTSYIESELPENNIALKNWYSNDKFYIGHSKTNNVDFFVENDVKKTPDFRIKKDKNFTSRLASK